MRFFICVAVAGLLFFRSGAKEQIFATIPDNTPVKLMPYNKQTIMVGNRNIALIGNKNKVTTIIEQTASIADAAIKGDELWLGTDKGIKIYSLEDFKLKQTYFSSERICGVATDAFNRMWVATTLKGVYMMGGDSFTNKLNIPGVYSLLCTADSNIWIGTNVGLYRIAGSNFKMTRYAEEGYSGYELPDNLVEKLYKDGQSNVWVIMPDHISFKRNAQYQGEIPSYAYIGDKQNEIRTIVPVKGASYIFVTKKGLYFLPSSSIREAHHSHVNEVFTTENIQAFALELKQLNAPEKLLQAPVTYAENVDGEIYFITTEGGWKVKEKDLLKHVIKR